MNPWKKRLPPVFHDAGKAHHSYIITLTSPAADVAAQAKAFRSALERWLLLQGEGQKGSAKAPAVLPVANTGHARVSLDCTERLMALIERQFGRDILHVDPPAQFIRGAIIPPKTDPWDISKW